jgi:tetratricopeptide (TPR) repeat protein
MLAIEVGDYQRARDACERAVSIAQRESDVHLEVQALGNGAEADLNYFQWEDGLQKCQRAVELAQRGNAVHAEMYARFFACMIFWLSGGLVEAHTFASALLARAEQLRDRRWRVNAYWLAGTVARDRGDWVAARAFTNHGQELSPTDPQLLWTRIRLEHETGSALALGALVDTLLEVVPLAASGPDLAEASTALMLASLPEIVLAAGVRDTAESTAETILSFPNATDLVRATSHASLALAGLTHSDPHLRRHYVALRPVCGTLILYLGMAADRLLGRLARAMGEPDVAARHFDDALRFCRKHCCRPELAWSCYDYADLLLATDGEGNRARDLLAETLTISSELGMHLLTELAQTGA